MEQKNKSKLYDIHCHSCGGPAKYEIKSHYYKCQYCGSKVGISEAIQAHQGFRSIQKQKMHESLSKFELQKAVCTGCGAEVIFDKGDAIAHCAFCGRELVREEFVKLKNIPELIIPFSITKDEAQNLLLEWCSKNHLKNEAKALKVQAENITGCYLPYELVKGPVYCYAERIDGGNIYNCEGFVDEVFVNCSKNLDNLLLDGMEPYNLEELTEFDFAYVAGHQVKTGDITGDELKSRINDEVTESYKPVVQKTFEAKAVDIGIASGDLVRMPVLLPVYYISFGNYMAAVNGQTGKVSVRAIKESHYYILPWWFKAIGSTVMMTALITLGMKLFGAAKGLITEVALIFGGFFLIVMLTAYADTKQKWFRVQSRRKIFTSKGGPYIRKGKELVQSDKELKRPETKPMFFMKINGREEHVALRFTTFFRLIRMFAIAIAVIFLPVIFALIINGFKFSQINLGGSAVWFCLAVPLTPVFVVKYGRMGLYDNPWIYIIDENGKKKRYKERHYEINELFQELKDAYLPRKDSDRFSLKDIITLIFKMLFTNKPYCFIYWGILLFFGTMVYLTAFGFID